MADSIAIVALSGALVGAGVATIAAGHRGLDSIGATAVIAAAGVAGGLVLARRAPTGQALAEEKQ